MTKAFIGISVALACLACLIVIGGVAFFMSLPDPLQIKKCLTTEMYHVKLCDTEPNFTPFNQISPYIIGAVIMSEDAAFYSHKGVDLDEMKESAIKDYNEGRFARGASTITQQLAKNIFLSKDKSILRKLEEIYLALQIEKLINKQRILTLYLNVVEFGPDIYGVKAASKYYFKKAPSQVTPEEGAFLAFLLPNPKKYGQSFAKKQLSPFANKTLRTILRKMLLGHKITEGEYAAADARISEFPWDGTVAAQPMGPGTVLPNDESPQDTSVDEAEDTSVGAGQAAVPALQDSDEANQDDNNFQFDFDPDKE